MIQHGLIGFKLLSAGLATISLIGSGVGIGVIFGCLMVAVARNPFLIKQLFSYAILGFALTEAIASFGSMTAFLLLFAFQFYNYFFNLIKLNFLFNLCINFSFIFNM